MTHFIALLTSVVASAQEIIESEVPLKLMGLVDNSRNDRGRKEVGHSADDMRDQRWIAQ